MGRPKGRPIEKHYSMEASSYWIDYTSGIEDDPWVSFHSVGVLPWSVTSVVSSVVPLSVPWDVPWKYMTPVHLIDRAM